ncbi:TPA: YqeG family HAD IIIA-type phosphatase [Streptococcus suis]
MSLENYMPDFALEKAYDVTVDSLKKHGIKVVFVDLDNTLIAWNNPDGTPEMRQWLYDLRDAGIPVVVVSNNKYERVKRAVEKFGIEFEAFALKPFTFGINRALKRFHVQPHEVVMIGDQLMTDIRAAKRAGLKSVLVKPLIRTDSINTQINRWRERRTMKKIIATYGAIDYKREM